jgi:tetratricopeptide (TPR) repeat protein
MNRRATYGVLLGAAVLGGFVSVWKLQERVDAERTRLQLENEELALRSPAVMKKLSLEYAPLMGAIYWTRAVQYFGGKHQVKGQNLDQLWPLLDIATTLDPNLLVAYRFGATFLSDTPPRGAGEPEKAVGLLERGIKANPEYWRFYQDLGNVYYFDKKDYLKASQAFEAGSRLPGAPPFMKIMAAKIAAEGESLETSFALWLDIYQTSTNKDMRKNAEDHLRLVKMEMDLRAVNQIADAYERKTKQRATRLSDLAQAGLLAGQPADPDGFPYVLGEQGKAEPNPKSPLREEWLREKKQRSNEVLK